jgi:hypothetical protein
MLILHEPQIYMYLVINTCVTVLILKKLLAIISVSIQLQIQVFLIMWM